VISQMTHHAADPGGDGANGDHTRASATWLNGVHPKHTSGADVRAGITADQVAAKVLGKETAMPSLELAIDIDYLAGGCENGYSCVYVNTLSWMGPTEPLPTENNPRVVFEKLFGDGGSAQHRLARARRGHSILDWAIDEMDRLNRTLGAADQRTVDDYFDSVREIEARIQRIEKQTGESPELPLTRPTAIPTRFDEHVKLMFDLQWLAFQTDTTRVVTFMFGREMNGRAYPELGIPEAHHALSHHRDNPETMLKVARINIYQAEQFAYFLQKLSSTREGDGTLLDNTHILYGAGLSDPNAHAHRDMALLVAGGGAARHYGGRHVLAPVDAPMCNLLLTLLDRAGVPTDKLGDSTGRFNIEPATPTGV
jgi:hypothetical protein